MGRGPLRAGTPATNSALAFRHALFGTAFSIYLTFLEPFVIGATRAWCLTSAMVITALFWLIAPYARSAARSFGRVAH